MTGKNESVLYEFRYKETKYSHRCDETNVHILRKYVKHISQKRIEAISCDREKNGKALHSEI